MAGSDSFGELEQTDAIRLSWNVWPSNRIEATKAVIPLGALYTPVKHMPHMTVGPPTMVKTPHASTFTGYFPADMTITLLVSCHPIM